jgi:5'-deoxynucleotidase
MSTPSPFFALLHRLRSTIRWSGMMALQPEDVAQHSFGVVMIAHALCEIDKEIYGLQPPTLDVLVAALYHDSCESILTDVVAPVKKYNPQMEQAFANLERLAEQQLLDTLPDPLRPAYTMAFAKRRGVVADYVHAADKLDALCKCKQELRRGNQEFAIAERQIEASCRRYAEKLPSVGYFMDVFLPAFEHSVDEYRYLQYASSGTGQDGSRSVPRTEEEGQTKEEA